MNSNITMILMMAVIALPCVSAPNHQDESRTDVRREAHKFLFEEFIEGKRCVYSKNKAKLQDVVVFERKIAKIIKEEAIELPAKTEQAVRFFDQLVIKGENLKRPKVMLEFGGQSKPLKLIASPSSQELVFRMLKIPLSEIQKNKSSNESDSSALTLHVESSDEISVDEILLRSTGDLLVQYDEYQKRLFRFRNDMIGRLTEEFYLSTAKQDFAELSEALSKPSEAFDRLVYTRTMASSGNDTHPLRGIVNDPRVAKLYGELLNMNEAEASEVASTIFDRSLSEFKASWEVKGIQPNSAVYSVNAHLFLCSEFCSASEVLGKIDAWETWHAIRASNPRELQFRHTAKLEQTYSMNLIMNIIRRERDLTIDELNSFVAAKLGPSLMGPPSDDPRHGKGGGMPPKLEVLEMATYDSNAADSTLLVTVLHIGVVSSLNNPIRKEALMEILRSELSENSQRP